MHQPSSKSVPYYYKNLYTPPLSQEHVEQIYRNHLKNVSIGLPQTTSIYLRELSYAHYLTLLCYQDGLVYDLEPHDLRMYLFGMDAPLSLIVAAPFVAKKQYSQAINQIGFSLECDDFLRYNIVLQNRLHEISQFFDPEDETTVIKVFDYLCEKPFYRKEEYFLAGCETSKLLYNRAIIEINKILKSFEKPK